jgi:hypothetical protein
MQMMVQYQPLRLPYSVFQMEICRISFCSAPRMARRLNASLPPIRPPILLPVWCCSIRCGRAPLLLRFLGTISKRGCITLVLAPRAIHTHIFWAPWCVVPAMAIDTICLRIPFCQILNNSSQLLLENFNTLLNDRIRFQISYTLDLEIESLRDRIKIKWFTLLRRFFPFGVLAFWPGGMSAELPAAQRRGLLTILLQDPPHTTDPCVATYSGDHIRIPRQKLAPIWHAPSQFPSSQYTSCAILVPSLVCK